MPRGWFADTASADRNGPEGFPYQPVLQCDGMAIPFDIWFRTSEECEQWIKDEVLGVGMYDEQ